ncbi:hypothetical protein WAB97_016495 [Stenotrophomonas maltophilia]
MDHMKAQSLSMGHRRPTVSMPSSLARLMPAAA